jgi:ketosteroid isomerase-like protein
MAEHENATRCRVAFEALWQNADLEPTLALLADDVVWINDIGAGPWHEFHGKQGVLDLFTGWMAFFDGGFEHRLIDICASDHTVIEILHEVGTARGQRFDNLAYYHFELDDKGLISHVHTVDRDRENIEAFWAAVGPVSAETASGSS